jgi:hypothetical protein
MTTTWEVMKTLMTQKATMTSAPLTTMQRATATNGPTWQRPLTRMATNQKKVKECKDRGAEERASPRCCWKSRVPVRQLSSSSIL